MAGLKHTRSWNRWWAASLALGVAAPVGVRAQEEPSLPAYTLDPVAEPVVGEVPPPPGQMGDRDPVVMDEAGGEQPVGAVETDAAAQPGMIKFQLPENVPLTTLIAYVSTRLNLNIVYDEAQVNQRVTLRTPAAIPESALLELLNAVLRSRSLVLQDTEVPWLMRIVPAQQLPEVAGLSQAGEPMAKTGAVTRVFPLKYARAERVNGLVAPFVTKPGGTISVLPEEQIVVVTDYTENLARISDLIALIDTERGEAVIQPIEIEHGDAQALLRVVQPLLQARARASGDPQTERSVMVTADPRTNQLLVVGMPPVVEQTVELVKSLDAPRALERRVYRPSVISPDRLDAQIKQVLNPEPNKANYRSAADTRAGTLVVTAPVAVHEQIASLLEELDVLPTAEQAPVRFYKLTNTLAKDVLDTLESLQSGGQSSGRSRTSRYDNVEGVRYGGGYDDRDDRRRRGRFGDDDDSRGFGGDSSYRSYQLDPNDTFIPTEGSPTDPAVGEVPGMFGDTPGMGEPELQVQIPVESGGAALVPSGQQRRRSTIAMDENTNSIIVVAPPAEQRIYEQIIQQLDQRRPQVLVETTIVTLDTSDNFQFGVEVAAASGDGKIISLSAFGLSEIDPETGTIDIPGSTIEEPLSGGTLGILDPDVASVVIRALSTNTRSKLVSMPRVLVNDNEDGILESVQQEPYTVTVVPGGDVAVESSDYAEAGTRISVTPHISEGDYLQLEYAVELSNFTGEALPNQPPPQLNNVVESRVTIPDGHTIVVGGLNQSNLTETIQKVPFLGDIPIIKHLFRNTARGGNNTTLFVFIRPTIMRDDNFRDLKYISGIDRQAAEVRDDYPQSEPMMITPAPLSAPVNPGDAVE